MICFGKELLSWLNKSPKLVSGFKGTELFLLEISMSFLLSAEEEKSLSVKFQNGRIVLQHDKQNQGLVDPWIIIVNKVKSTTLHLYPELT